MKSFALNSNNDYDIQNGSVSFVRGVDDIAQTIVQRVLAREGENPLDNSQGIPYDRIVFTRNPDFALIETVYALAVASVPGVDTVLRVVANFENIAQRKASIRIVVLARGEEVEVEVPLNAQV